MGGRAPRLVDGLVFAGALALLAAVVVPASAQLSVDRDTRVRQVRFSLPDAVDVDEDELRGQVATRGPAHQNDLRRSLGRLPFIPEVEDPRFDPIELQRDKERLRRFLGRLGYPRSTVDYDVSSLGENQVEVLFHIDPGTPITVRATSLVWADRQYRPDLDEAAVLEGADPQSQAPVGEPLDRRTLDPAAAEVRRWFGDEGHPFASVEARVYVDETRSEAEIVYLVESGHRARIGSIEIVGLDGLDERDVRDRLEIAAGDWFSLTRLREASRRVAALDIVQNASFDIRPGQPDDEQADLVLRVVELPRRTTGGQIGYTSDGGIAGDLRWSDRNLLGGARTLTLTLAGQSGVLALDANAEQYLRGSATVRQPVFHPLLVSATAGPFVEYRDDYRDRSFEGGIDLALVRPFGRMSSVALSWEISSRRVFEYRLGDISAGLDFLDLLEEGADGALSELGTRIDRSVVTLSASILELDSPGDPRVGWTISPALSATVTAFNATQFVSASVRATGYVPLGASLGLAARVGVGRLEPFGRSVPATPEDGLVQLLRLRDELFTAGGLDDVRGWRQRLLGPKFPDAVFVMRDSTVQVEADGYTPLGGLSRGYGTLELRFPVSLPAGSWSGHAFLDAGRVWTGDARFGETGDPYGVERLFWGTGFGLGYETLLGSIRISVGYKLNPSVLDLADAQDVLDALLADMPLSGVPMHDLRRFRLYIGIGGAL